MIARREASVNLRRLFLGRRRHGLENFRQVVVRSRDHLNADHFADTTGRCGTGVGRRFDSRDVAADEYADHSAADLVPTQELDVGRFHHCVGRFDQGNKPFGLDHAERFIHLCHWKICLLKGERRSKDYFWQPQPPLVSSTSDAPSKWHALPSSVSMWTSNLAASSARTNTSSKTVVQS